METIIPFLYIFIDASLVHNLILDFLELGGKVDMVIASKVFAVYRREEKINTNNRL